MTILKILYFKKFKKSAGQDFKMASHLLDAGPDARGDDDRGHRGIHQHGLVSKDEQ